MSVIKEFKVVVKCLTFNQSKYIIEAMNGFTMQQTNFPYVCCIVDDASTDDELVVIREYVQNNFEMNDKSTVRLEETDDYSLMFARHKSNINCYFAVFFLKYNHYTIKKSKIPYLKEWYDNVKYMAICEGDDYWINPMKLQRQVDLLDNDVEMGMVHTDCAISYGDSLKMTHSVNRVQTKNTLIDTTDWRSAISAYYRGDFVVRTCTSLMRIDILNDIMDTDPFLFDGHLALGDTQMWVGMLLKKKRIGYIDDETSVYRVLEGSASHATSYRKQLLFAISRYEIRLYYKRNYNILNEFSEIENKYKKFVRIYRFLFDPTFKDINGFSCEQNFMIRILSRIKIIRWLLSLVLQVRIKLAGK